MYVNVLCTQIYIYKYVYIFMYVNLYIFCISHVYNANGYKHIYTKKKSRLRLDRHSARLFLVRAFSAPSSAFCSACTPCATSRYQSMIDSPPWRQPRGKWMVSLGFACTPCAKSRYQESGGCRLNLYFFFDRYSTFALRHSTRDFGGLGFSGFKVSG